jgi:hypothetical protein
MKLGKFKRRIEGEEGHKQMIINEYIFDIIVCVHPAVLLSIK